MIDLPALALAVTTLLLVVVLNRRMFEQVPNGRLLKLAAIWALAFALGTFVVGRLMA